LLNCDLSHSRGAALRSDRCVCRKLPRRQIVRSITHCHAGLPVIPQNFILSADKNELKSYGNEMNGEEATETISIPLDKIVTKRTVNYSNCRVIAYVLKKSGANFYINNTASCPVNGSTDYNYED
jgi:hypothetical protein